MTILVCEIDKKDIILKVSNNIIKQFPSLGKIKIKNLTVKRFGYNVTYTLVKRWDSAVNKEVFIDGKGPPGNWKNTSAKR